MGALVALSPLQSCKCKLRRHRRDGSGSVQPHVYVPTATLQVHARFFLATQVRFTTTQVHARPVLAIWGRFATTQVHARPLLATRRPVKCSHSRGPVLAARLSAACSGSHGVRVGSVRTNVNSPVWQVRRPAGPRWFLWTSHRQHGLSRIDANSSERRASQPPARCPTLPSHPLHTYHGDFVIACFRRLRRDAYTLRFSTESPRSRGHGSRCGKPCAATSQIRGRMLITAPLNRAHIPLFLVQISQEKSRDPACSGPVCCAHEDLSFT